MLNCITEPSLCPQQDSPINLRQARRLLGRETVDRVLEHGRHHHDDRGRPWWFESELDELDELGSLVAIETSREEGV
jgi:hypothetical protein